MRYLQVLIETVSSAKHISSFVCKVCLLGSWNLFLGTWFLFPGYVSSVRHRRTCLQRIVSAALHAKACLLGSWNLVLGTCFLSLYYVYLLT